MKIESACANVQRVSNSARLVDRNRNDRLDRYPIVGCSNPGRDASRPTESQGATLRPTQGATLRPTQGATHTRCGTHLAFPDLSLSQQSQPRVGRGGFVQTGRGWTAKPVGVCPTSARVWFPTLARRRIRTIKRGRHVECRGLGPIRPALTEC
jgi:hypothetical protein